MTRYGKISDGVLVAINVTSAKEVAAEWMPIPDDAKVGFIQDGDAYTAPPEPEPEPQILSRVQFVRLCMSAGGMTNELLVAAKADESLAALWILLEMSDEVRKDAPEVPGGIAGLDALEYLPNGAQAVMDAWPT